MIFIGKDNLPVLNQHCTEGFISVFSFLCLTAASLEYDFIDMDKLSKEAIVSI